MYKINKITGFVIAALMLLTNAAGVSAAYVDFTINGTVTTSLPIGKVKGTDVYYGDLLAGDTVTVVGSFDNSALAGDGSGMIDFSSGSGNSFTINAGTLTFTEANDEILAPYIDLHAGGVLYDFTFGAVAGINGAPADFNSFFTDFDAGTNFSGNWNGITVSAVPVPAAVWLFGSGILGLAGLARRKD